MVSLSGLKPFLPLLITFVLPRAISWYRTVKVAIRTRPQPRPLPSKTTYGLNILFASICMFLYATLPRSRPNDQNIFSLTNARLQAPTDVLFSRLALIRPGGLLTAFDEALQTKITSINSRKVYLRFGPRTMVECSFCQPDDDVSYLLHYLPTNVMLPHLYHLFVLGLATSEGICGFEARQWRNKVCFGALVLLGLDLFGITSYASTVDINLPAPSGLFWQARMMRFLTLSVFDIAVAALIYASATNRLLLFSSSSTHDPELARRQREQLLNQTNIALQRSQTKIRAFSVVRNATVRQPILKSADDEYWRAVVAMEGPPGEEGVWDDEEVQAAIARSLGSGNIDVSRMRREAEAFVTNITKELNK